MENARFNLINALQKNRYNLTKTAKELGISRGTLYKKIDQYNIR
ncbi:MAG TPA: helix-turn-helix domain-containing protein [Metabacillus sp.]|nr:helix-turn-helix domain-containing protein [Metabacillus sp.]